MKQLTELIKIQSHRSSNYISSDIISNSNRICGIEAIWIDENTGSNKITSPVNNELCLVRIEGNYELNTQKKIWLHFETWDSNQSGISSKEHIDSNRLCYGRIVDIKSREPKFIEAIFEVNKVVSYNNNIESKPIDTKWKTTLIEFSELDFTGALLSVFSFDKYISALCQTDGGPFFNFIFENKDRITLKQILESDKYDDILITYTNEVVDPELENILLAELNNPIKVFRKNDKSFNKFLFYYDSTSNREEGILRIRDEINAGNGVVLRKKWNKIIVESNEDIEKSINQMKDYH